ncbi:flagellar basal-body MS-ring/collar protein FliF [Thermodesulfobacteriota bacterium]
MAEAETNFIQQSLQVFKAIPPGKKLSLALLLLMIVGGFIALMLWANRPDFQVLFTNLDPADASKISERLKEKRIPFQLREGGRAILVPDESVYQLRLELATDGVPRGRNVGFEIFDKVTFGTTEFVQRLRYQQALQGELARTIMQFDAIENARVHLVAAADSLFVEPEKPSTASIVLSLHSGRTLDGRQLQGIINLVACAVEGLKPENVTIVDTAGGLLSKGHQEDHAGALSRTQFEYQRRLEKTLESRIQSMLEPVVGLNRVVARVSGDVDFRQINISEEQFDPDSLVVRSEQRQKEASSEENARPSGSPDLKYQAYKSRSGSASSSQGFHKENSVINYEINKVNRQTISSVGDIKRLTAAVIIDGPYVTQKDAEGNTIQKFSPRSKKELKTFENIIKKAIGFNQSRGDQVSVSNIPFALQEDKGPFPEKAPGWMDYAKKGTKPFFNVVLILLFFLLAVRPFKRWLKQTGDYVGTQALLPGQDIPRLESETGTGNPSRMSRQELLDMTKNNPDKVAEMIRNWMSEEK